MHLSDAFIQSDIQCIQAIHFIIMCVPWELIPQLFPQEHLKINHQTPMTYGHSHFIHFKTVATEVEIQCLSTLIMFPSLLPQFGSAFFSSTLF